MKRTAQDILNFVEDNDVKFAKLTFCDIFGNQKNVSLFASELPRAFAEGVSFDGSSIAGFMNVEESDLVLWPDPDTATVLPTGSPSKHQSKLASSLQQMEGITVMPLLCQYAPR